MLGTSIQISYNTNYVVLSDNFYSSKYTIQYNIYKTNTELT
jgi:hypothetical protein